MNDSLNDRLNFRRFAQNDRSGRPLVLVPRPRHHGARRFRGRGRRAPARAVGADATSRDGDGRGSVRRARTAPRARFARTARAGAEIVVVGIVDILRRVDECRGGLTRGRRRARSRRAFATARARRDAHDARDRRARAPRGSDDDDDGETTRETRRRFAGETGRARDGDGRRATTRARGRARGGRGRRNARV